MRKAKYNLESIKSKIKKLQGTTMEITVNKGRNKYVTLIAFIEKVYPSMFSIKPLSVNDLDKTTYSYSEVLCGNIKFKLIKQVE